MSKLIHAEETYAIRGAVFAVYKEMGCGVLEAVYQECLEKELKYKPSVYSVCSVVKQSKPRTDMNHGKHG